MRTVLEPSASTDSLLGARYQHPAFATICATRLSNSGRESALFGTQVASQGVVRIQLTEAELHRSGYQDRIMGTGRVVAEFEMTAAQWAQFVTTGGGEVPCTLRACREGEMDIKPLLPAPDLMEAVIDRQIEDMVTQSDRNARDAAATLLEDLAAILPKKKMEDIRRTLDTVVGLGASSRKFQHEALIATKERIVHDAHLEIEAGGRAFIERAGLHALVTGAVSPSQLLTSTPDSQAE